MYLLHTGEGFLNFILLLTAQLEIKQKPVFWFPPHFLPLLHSFVYMQQKQKNIFPHKLMEYAEFPWGKCARRGGKICASVGKGTWGREGRAG